jgi:hypothetical protein
LFVLFGGAEEEEQRILAYFEDLMKGSAISPAPSDLFAILEIAGFLGKRELIEGVIEAPGPITASNVWNRLQTKSRFGCWIESEVGFG